ncbi:MAG TPA: hypothetical protein VEK38_04455 [Candidatus Bathyarchaeia archaeon]|nr:hypothetical protein [Candidatus Bathyarchaeia archaeon]
MISSSKIKIVVIMASIGTQMYGSEQNNALPVAKMVVNLGWLTDYEKLGTEQQEKTANLFKDYLGKKKGMELVVIADIKNLSDSYVSSSNTKCHPLLASAYVPVSFIQNMPSKITIQNNTYNLVLEGEKESILKKIKSATSMFMLFGYNEDKRYCRFILNDNFEPLALSADELKVCKNLSRGVCIKPHFTE